MLKSFKQLLYLALSVTSIIGARQLYELAKYCKSSYCLPSGLCTMDCIYHIDTSNLIISLSLMLFGLAAFMVTTISIIKSRKSKT